MHIRCDTRQNQDTAETCHRLRSIRASDPFPQGTDLRVPSAEQLGAELNARPRKTLGWDTPAARLTRLRGETAAPPRSVSTSHGGATPRR
jgi:hypothetical protein